MNNQFSIDILSNCGTTGQQDIPVVSSFIPTITDSTNIINALSGICDVAHGDTYHVITTKIQSNVFGTPQPHMGKWLVEFTSVNGKYKFYINAANPSILPMGDNAIDITSGVGLLLVNVLNPIICDDFGQSGTINRIIHVY